MMKNFLTASLFTSHFPVQRSQNFHPSITPFWLGLWACALAFTWLLPNNYLPWRAFHPDAWVAIVLGLGAAAVILQSRAATMWHWTALLVAGLVGVPLIQFAFNILPFAGQAWISTAYLLGLLLALLTGARWESASPGQVAGGLFFAIGVASVLSVGLQLIQWLDLRLLDLWSKGLIGGRPYANLGQPNQLGTLLLWGLLACAWGVATKKMRAPVAILMAAFLLFGIALTQSRTAWLGLFLLFCAAWGWRRYWPSKWMPWIVTALVAYFFLCMLLVQWQAGTAIVHSAGGAPELGERLSTELRPTAWRLFIDAAMQRPWFGYGWTPVAGAQLAVALNHPGLGVIFQHAHNLFLDLVLWCGLPLGLFVSGSVIYWFWQCIRAVSNVQDAILLMFVALVGNHAMLELPLHYAYFLLPTGIVMGVLNARLAKPVIRTSRWTLIGIWVMAAVILAVSIRDYFIVEANYFALRFERAQIGTLPRGTPPDVVLLTQLREELRLARFEPKAGMNEEDINWVRKSASLSPGTSELFRLAKTLALNHHSEEAQQVLKKLCKIVPANDCALVKRVWTQESLHQPEIAVVSWPN